MSYGVENGLCEPPSMGKLRFPMPRVDNKKTENMTQEQAQQTKVVTAENGVTSKTYYVGFEVLTSDNNNLSA